MTGAASTQNERAAVHGRARLIVFARFPEPGVTKTRLIPALGGEGATALAEAMTRHVLDWARAAAGGGAFDIEVRHTGGDAARMGDRFGRDLRYAEQGDGDLGARMARAFGDAFARGFRRVLTIGTDCPAVTAAVLHEAFDSLGEHDAVIGPATDGGYYLIGLSRMEGRLFEGIEWGTERVLGRTLEAVKRAGLSVRLLDPLEDIDRPEDLPLWAEARRSFVPPRRADRLSVIVPTLNEQAVLARTLTRLRYAPDVELIVADGGSTDQTVRIAERLGARVVRSERGRARQMNRGAAEAGGDILLFCHADTVLPGDYADRVRRTSAEPGVVGGAFELEIEHHDDSLRWVEWVVRFRCRAASMPYGDQAIFVNRGAFERLGGYREMPIMEDYELMRGLRQLGVIRVIPAPALTSGRYWQRHGAARTSLVNRAIVVGYHLGVPAGALARFRASWR